MTRRKASYIQGTTAVKYQLPAEDARLNDAAGWTPGASGLLVRGGVVPGPGGPGVVTAATGGVNIAAGTAVVQGTTTSVQGAYRCTWDASEFRAVTADSGTTYRRFILVVRLYDQLNGGAKDDWDLEVVYGAGAATLAAATVPPTPANSLVIKSGSVDPSGVVSVSGVLPLTVPRGGILPVDATETTAGAYVGHYRDHPTLGLQRWSGTIWTAAGIGGAVYQRGGTVVGAASANPKIYAALYDVSFTGVSYALINVAYPAGFFSEVPSVQATFAVENAQAVYGGHDQHTVNGCLVVLRAGVNITATYVGGLHVLAVGR